MTSPLYLVESDSSSSPDPEAPRLYYVPPGPATLFWFGKVSTFFQRALLRTNRQQQIEEILGRVLVGDADLWVVLGEENETLCALTTRIMHSAQAKWCVIDACGGKDMRRWIHLLKEIESWARSNGCTRMQVPGRTGWGRVLPEYEHAYCVLEKEL